MSYFKYNVNPSKRVGMDRVFLGLAGLLLGISPGLCPREIPRSSPASPQKTLSIPPLLLGLTHYIIHNNGILKSNTTKFSWSEGYITNYPIFKVM